MDEHTRQFHLEEYKQLRSEITGLLSRIELLFRYSLLVVATVFAWLLVNSLSVLPPDPGVICVRQPRSLLFFGWLIPPLFVAGAGRMAQITNVRVTEIGEYLLKLESALGSDLLGWERHLAQKKAIITPTTINLWWLMFALTLSASIVGLCTIAGAGSVCPVPKP